MDEDPSKTLNAIMHEFELDKRYPGDDVPDVVHAVLKDEGARLKGYPQWSRGENPELYDAIVLIRDMIIRAHREMYPDESPFNIGSSYQRWINSWLSSKRHHDLFLNVYANNDPALITALNVFDRRVSMIINS